MISVLYTEQGYCTVYTEHVYWTPARSLSHFTSVDSQAYTFTKSGSFVRMQSVNSRAQNITTKRRLNRPVGITARFIMHHDLQLPSKVCTCVYLDEGPPLRPTFTISLLSLTLLCPFLDLWRAWFLSDLHNVEISLFVWSCGIEEGHHQLSKVHVCAPYGHYDKHSAQTFGLQPNRRHERCN